MPRRGWTGPPPTLLAATVVGFVAAMVLSAGPGQASGPDPSATLARSSSETAEAPRLPDKTPRTELRAPVARQVVGVASFNAYRELTVDQTKADAAALATNPAVDVIGWQEAYKIGAIAGTLGRHGWDTQRFSGAGGELAVSWRRDRFELVDSFQRFVAPGVSDEQGSYPVGARFVVRVTLREKKTGELVSVLDTHLPQAIEDLDRPGHWRGTYNSARARRLLAAMAPMWQSAPGRWTVGTGDFNFDVDAERQVRPKGGPSRRFDGSAVSSYQRLGTDVYWTHPVTGRRIDYVLAAADDLRADRITFLRQWTVPGLNSDHRALLVRLALT